MKVQEKVKIELAAKEMTDLELEHEADECIEYAASSTLAIDYLNKALIYIRELKGRVNGRLSLKEKVKGKKQTECDACGKSFVGCEFLC